MNGTTLVAMIAGSEFDGIRYFADRLVRLPEDRAAAAVAAGAALRVEMSDADRDSVRAEIIAYEIREARIYGGADRPAAVARRVDGFLSAIPSARGSR